MFFRTVINELKKWAEDPNRKPLVLRGARQVGKTTAVEIFSKEFNQYVYLNLEKKEDLEIFNQNLPIDELIEAIFFEKNTSSTSTAWEEKILLFIDEIQNSPQAVAMLRYFHESAKHIYVIAAGSLLESMIGENKISFPVGRVQYLFMSPLSFEEFIMASGETKALEYYNTIPLPKLAFSKLQQLFRKYTLIGGMPEVVKIYNEKKDIISLTPIYQGLLTSYLDDVSKYARNDTMDQCLRHAIETAPLEAGKRIKFHGFGNSNYRSREMGEALRTLERAMLIYLLYPSTSTQPPAIPDLKSLPDYSFLIRACLIILQICSHIILKILALIPYTREF